MRVLVLAADVPFPPVGGARTRNHHLLRALAGEHDVRVCAFHWGDELAEPPFPVALRTVPWEAPPLHAAADAGDPEAWRALNDPEAEPFGVSSYDSPAMEAAVADACAEGVDVVVMTETAMGRFRELVPAGVPCVFDLHDVHTARIAATGGEPSEVARMRRFESRVAQSCELTLCVSALEAEAARALLGAPAVEVVPNGVDTSYFTPGDGPGEEDRVVFTGSMHTAANAEAATWLVRDVLPRLRERRPRVTVDVVGAGPTEDVLALEGPGVRVHGRVPDVRGHLHSAAVAVVPIRRGSGTRLKLLEAAATGRAIVTTGIGMEGLDFVADRDVVVADDPAPFAEAIAALCADPARRSALGSAARVAAAPYEWERIGARYRALVEVVAGR